MATDPFSILGAERRYDLDLAALEKTHRELSRALHPDKFAQAGASERRASLEKAASVNEAWRTLRDPIRRAEALFSVGGLKVGENNEPKASPAFLMEMMEEREALADARIAKDLAKVRAFGAKIAARNAEAEAQLVAGFRKAFGSGAESSQTSSQHTLALEAVLPLLGELRFYKRFLDEVSAIEEEEEDAL